MHWFLMLALAAICTPASSQYSETIQGGRPGQAMGAFTIGKAVLQFEQGITVRRQTYEVGEWPIGETTVTSFTNNNAIRYGFAERWEASAIVVTERAEIDAPEVIAAKETGLSVRQVRLRYLVAEESEQWPALTLQSGVLLPWSSEVFTRDNAGYVVQAAASKELCDWLSMFVNLGVTHAGNGGASQAFYVIGPSFSVSDKISILAELYGRFDPADINSDIGVSYVVSDNLQLDVLVGAQGYGQFEGDLPEVDDDWFVSAGVSYRFDWRREAP